MKASQDQSRVQGLNFEGFAECLENTLTLNLVQFKKGELYCCKLSNQMLQNDLKRYIIFKNVDKLYSELIKNTKLQIKDQVLILLALVNFNEDIVEIKVQMQLYQPKFNDEIERNTFIFKHIEKMHRFYNILQSQKIKLVQERKEMQELALKQSSFEMSQFMSKTPQLIRFRGDPTNQKPTFFEIEKNKVRVIGTNQHTIFNHCETLPKFGIHYFKFKILRSAAKQIIVGICGKNIKYQINAAIYQSPYFMGFNYSNGHLHWKAGSIATGAEIFFTEESVLEVQINLSTNNVTWIINDRPIHLAQIPKDLMDVYIYPCVVMHAAGDVIEFINK